MAFFDDANTIFLFQRFVRTASTCSEVARIPQGSVFVSHVEFKHAVVETENYINAIMHRRSVDRVSVGKIAGPLAYWLNQYRTVTINPNSDLQTNFRKFQELVVMTFIVQTFIKQYPPANVFAEALLLLRDGHLNPESLSLFFDTLMAFSGMKIGTPFEESIK